MTTRRTRLIVALDTKDEAQATRWRDQTAGSADAIKLGLEFTYARGLDAVRRVADGHGLFLDLKLHDIPNTVGSAVGSLAETRPAMLTIHAQGGSAMIAAARTAVDRAFPPDARPLLLAVTVLTSMDAEALREIGVNDDPCQQVLRLGALAIAAGADGLICSPHEIIPLRDRLGDAPVLVVPGIRPAGAETGDQKRVMTPAQARRAGADWIVVGRPITTAADPAAAAAAVAAELAD
ncbi:orotidine-5'-phosphate decarboxylase [Gluconacetobacter takamatsuzukensis]|uniref:Orotidine 5'-phosphate decarboxylase n=1 Tax=Gluconacetobacter takamatsuzukensis TaxID=1286190 RepID=A0A7W4KBW8_9PROT|nr:orotidine-5'-phosphate decarboxylase [Gluconacetobacter takamatsuzukensis]MBB2204087.1 orotidine-5'-phosphate decarboxylase [Gluconacetobacter takamatsuzukensis]